MPDVSDSNSAGDVLGSAFRQMDTRGTFLETKSRCLVAMVIEKCELAARSFWFHRPGESSKVGRCKQESKAANHNRCIYSIAAVGLTAFLVDVKIQRQLQNRFPMRKAGD